MAREAMNSVVISSKKRPSAIAQKAFFDSLQLGRTYIITSSENQPALAAAAAAARQTRCKLETRAVRRFDKINPDRPGFFQQVFFNQISDAPVRYCVIIFLWLIQSHAQGGSASAILQNYSDSQRLLLLLQNLFDDTVCLFCDFEHIISLSELSPFKPSFRAKPGSTNSANGYRHCRPRA